MREQRIGTGDLAAAIARKHVLAMVRRIAALVANGFGWFLGRPGALPPLPGPAAAGAATALALEAMVRFP